MKMPRIIFFEQIKNQLLDTLSTGMSFLFSRRVNGNGRHATRIGFLFISILSLVACQPSWGAPPSANFFSADPCGDDPRADPRADDHSHASHGRAHAGGVECRTGLGKPGYAGGIA
jgi:hypothetical protein